MLQIKILFLVEPTIFLTDSNENNIGANSTSQKIMIKRKTS